MRTFDDQILQVKDLITTNDTSDRIARIARRAVRDAYQDIGSKNQWYYLIRRTQINTVAPYNTGTIQFTQATGEVVLTDGTFPTWAQYGELLINRNVYKVQVMVDSTHLILQPDRMPGTDLDAGTSYQLVRTLYDLPADFLELRMIAELERLWPLTMMPVEKMLLRTQIWFDPTEILFFTILGGQNGRMQILFSPPPASARTYDLVYQGRPRLRTLQNVYKTGSATTTSGSAVVNFSGGAVLPLNIEGCVLRLGNPSLPESDIGDNPYQEEHVVLQRNSNTQLTLEDTAISSLSAVMFTLDDPIDLETASQMSLFDRMCETRVLRLNGAANDVQLKAEAAEERAWRESFAPDERLASTVMRQITGLADFNIADGFWGVKASGP